MRRKLTAGDVAAVAAARERYKAKHAEKYGLKNSGWLGKSAWRVGIRVESLAPWRIQEGRVYPEGLEKWIDNSYLDDPYRYGIP